MKLENNNLKILTSSALPTLCPDDRNLVDCLNKNNIKAEILIWDKDQVPNDSKVLIRTVWDYALKKKEFLSLLSRLNPGQLINPVETVKWNMDKSYLVELKNKGASVVDTEVQYSFSPKDLEDYSYPIVVKPLVGASGYNTFLLKSYEEDTLSVLKGSDVLIQPFIESIQTIGEYSYIYFAGKFSHAVLKKAKSGEFRVQDDHGGTVEKYQPNATELEEVDNILKHVDHNWTYARVDVVQNNQALELMELELIEPELFFRFSTNGENRLAEAIKASTN